MVQTKTKTYATYSWVLSPGNLNWLFRRTRRHCVGWQSFHLLNDGCYCSVNGAKCWRVTATRQEAALGHTPVVLSLIH